METSVCAFQASFWEPRLKPLGTTFVDCSDLQGGPISSNSDTEAATETMDAKALGGSSTTRPLRRHHSFSGYVPYALAALDPPLFLKTTRAAASSRGDASADQGRQRGATTCPSSWPSQTRPSFCLDPLPAASPQSRSTTASAPPHVELFTPCADSSPKKQANAPVGETGLPVVQFRPPEASLCSPSGSSVSARVLIMQPDDVERHCTEELPQSPVHDRHRATMQFDEGVNLHAHNPYQSSALLVSGNVTTLMVRNLPHSITQEQLIEELDNSGFMNLYDFVYLPTSFEAREGKGYAFINFSSVAAAGAFVGAWHHSRHCGVGPMAPPLNISPASIQGLEANMRRVVGPRMNRIRNPGLRPFLRLAAEGDLPDMAHQQMHAQGECVDRRDGGGLSLLSRRQAAGGVQDSTNQAYWASNVLPGCPVQVQPVGGDASSRAVPTTFDGRQQPYPAQSTSGQLQQQQQQSQSQCVVMLPQAHLQNVPATPVDQYYVCHDFVPTPMPIVPVGPPVFSPVPFAAGAPGDATAQEQHQHSVSCSAPSEQSFDSFRLHQAPTKDGQGVLKGSGKDSSLSVTTVMIRNLPVTLTQWAFLEELDASGFHHKYDFAYLPTSFEDHEAKGYGFVNFISTDIARLFCQRWHRSRHCGIAPECPALNVSAAVIQGLAANVRKWDGPRMRRIRNQRLRPFVRPCEQPSGPAASHDQRSKLTLPLGEDASRTQMAPASLVSGADTIMCSDAMSVGEDSHYHLSLSSSAQAPTFGKPRLSQCVLSGVPHGR